MGKTTTLHVHHTFLYISLPSLHNYDVKWSKFELTRDWEWQGDKFYYLFLNSDAGPSLQFQHKFHIFKSLGDFLWGQKNLNGCSVNFLMTFPLTWTLLDRKVPIIGGTLSEIPPIEILLLVPTCVPGFENASWLACLKCHCLFANQDERKFKTLLPRTRVLALLHRGWFLVSCTFYLQTCIKLTFANKIEAMHERSLISVKVESRSTSHLSLALFILPIFFYGIKIYVH